MAAPSDPLGLRAARQALGITQKELAERLGVSDRMIRQLETGGKPGRNYADVVEALRSGRILAPRRRQAAQGGLARVRAQGGGSRAVQAVSRRPGGVTYTRSGQVRAVIYVPKKGTRGRTKARAQLALELDRAALKRKPATVSRHDTPDAPPLHVVTNVRPLEWRPGLEDFDGDGGTYRGLHDRPGYFLTVVY